ncbi:MAG: hypothetical protein RL729_532 [Actinomycetota bacterium]
MPRCTTLCLLVQQFHQRHLTLELSQDSRVRYPPESLLNCQIFGLMEVQSRAQTTPLHWLALQFEASPRTCSPLRQFLVLTTQVESLGSLETPPPLVHQPVISREFQTHSSLDLSEERHAWVASLVPSPQVQAQMIAECSIPLTLAASPQLLDARASEVSLEIYHEARSATPLTLALSLPLRVRALAESLAECRAQCLPVSQLHHMCSTRGIPVRYPESGISAASLVIATMATQHSPEFLILVRSLLAADKWVESSESQHASLWIRSRVQRLQVQASPEALLEMVVEPAVR